MFAKERYAEMLSLGGMWEMTFMLGDRLIVIILSVAIILLMLFAAGCSRELGGITEIFNGEQGKSNIMSTGGELLIVETIGEDQVPMIATFSDSHGTTLMGSALFVFVVLCSMFCFVFQRKWAFGCQKRMAV